MDDEDQKAHKLQKVELPSGVYIGPLISRVSAHGTTINAFAAGVDKAIAFCAPAAAVGSAVAYAAIGNSTQVQAVTIGTVVEVFTENDLRDMEQVSAYIDECNTRLSEKLAVLDHMEARRRLKMDELEAMVARL
jgi:hypothetical protein